jgi:hypothetical protein
VLFLCDARRLFGDALGAIYCCFITCDGVFTSMLDKGMSFSASGEVFNAASGLRHSAVHLSIRAS